MIFSSGLHVKDEPGVFKIKEVMAIFICLAGVKFQFYKKFWDYFLGLLICSSYLWGGPVLASF